MSKKLTELRRVREEQGYSRRELAKLSGIAESTITALELGITDIYSIKICTLFKLAKALNVHAFALLPNDIKIQLM